MKLLRSFLCELTVHEGRVYGLGDTQKKLTKKKESRLARPNRTPCDAIIELISTKCMKASETELKSDASLVELGAVICQFNPPS